LQQLPPDGWSVARLARYLKMDAGTLRYMRNGKRPTPDNLDDWLQRVAAEAEQAKQHGRPYQVTTLPDQWEERAGRKASDRT
jgi:20S proteasome alpha/beta subunit